jgi:hypothetical protein
MGPNLARPVAILVGAVAVLGSVGPLAAQNVPPADPLAVRMPDDAREVDVKAVVAIAVSRAVPLGFEEVGALTERVTGPFRGGAREKPIVSVRPRPYDVRGVTLRQALDALTRADRRYQWREIDGVAVIRPVAAWRDPAHPLLRPVGAVRLRNAPLSEMGDVIRGAIEPVGAREVVQVDERRVSIDFAGGTLFELLNATARSSGQLQWQLTSASHIILLDRGRAVEAREPALTVGGAALPLVAR